MTRQPAEQIQGPGWDLSTEYPAASGAPVEADLAEAAALMDRMAEQGGALAGPAPVPAAQTLFRLGEQVRRLLGNLSVYASCRLSVNSRDDEAQALQGRLQAYQTRFADLQEPLNQFTDLAEDAVIDAYLADPEVAPSAFVVGHRRQRRHELLGLKEEALINGLSQDGIHAWGKLYDQLSGTLTCAVPVANEVHTMGIAEANGLLLQPDVLQRRHAWQAINTAWGAHEETCTAALNAIAGWRLELCRRRSGAQPVHFLDAPVHMNRISRATLDTLMQVTERARPLAQRAAALQARAYGQTTIGPWDQRAPAPVLAGSNAAATPFADADELIAGAYGEVHPSMGDFVRMMTARRWVEGTVGGAKRPGAYCTNFPRSRSPRVYMTYTGGASDIITLAHELGHALHGWVMRDLPDSQRGYGMSLAETASTFGETLVRDALLARAGSPRERLAIQWEEMSALVAFLLNIPTRFEFERRFYEARQERPLRPQELKDLMSEAWRLWYGDALTEPDPLFWASKLHFYISGLSFYNFPYLFGYLFSLGVYASRDAHGAGFYDRYEALLRDTGRMTAEDLAAAHLGQDLTAPAFWQTTIDALAGRVRAFEELLDELDLTV